MKQTQGKSQKLSGRLKVFVMGTTLAALFWGTPLGADTGPVDTGSSLFSPGEPMHRMAPDPHYDNTNILLARGGGGGVAVEARAKAKVTAPKTAPAPRNAPKTAQATAPDPVKYPGMVRVKGQENDIYRF